MILNGTLNSLMYKLIALTSFISLLSACSSHLTKTNADTKSETVDLLSDNDLRQTTIDRIIQTELARTYLKENHAKVSSTSSIDIWQRIREGTQLETPDNPRVQQYIDRYKRMQKHYLPGMCQRAQPFMFDIANVLDNNQMPLDLALLPAVESDFKPMAYSHSQASGLWQFIPSTGKRLKLKQNMWYDGRRDPYESTRAAAKYLLSLNRIFKGDWLHTLASYNAGPGTILKAMRKNRKKGLSTDYWSLKLPKETMHYVPKLLGLVYVIRSTPEIGKEFCQIANTPVLKRVPINGQLDVTLAAKMANMKREHLLHLNSGIKRWATPVRGPHALNLPITKANNFLKKEQSLPKKKRMLWRQHRIKIGETLGHIAIRYDLPVSVLKSVNNLKSHRIRAGKQLRIPMQGQKTASNFIKKHTKTVHDKQKVRYPVRRGDSIYTIARKFNVSMNNILKWNKLSRNDYLQPKQILTLYVNTNQ